MGYNISEISGSGTPRDPTPTDPDDWLFEADLSSPAVTTITGTFSAQFLAPEGAFGQAATFTSTPVSPSGYGTLVLNPGGTFTFTIDRAAVIASNSDQIVTFQITGTSGAFSDTDDVSFSILICVLGGTLIATASGERDVATLARGDLVRLQDGRFAPIRWVGSRTVTPAEMQGDPSLVPIRIDTDAFGPGRPHRPLYVSPQHRIVIDGPEATLHFGEEAVLAPAKGLIDQASVRPAPEGRTVIYYHLLFERHEVILTNGLPTESFFPGDASMAGLDEATRREFQALFPEFGAGGYGAPALPGVQPWEARILTPRMTAAE